MRCILQKYLPRLFHANSDEEGIKIAGTYSYDVYVQLLKELIKCEIEPEPLPPLEVLLEATQFISSKEVAFIYDSQQEIERTKKLQLKRKVQMIEVKCERYLDRKKKTWCKHQVFSLRLIKILKGMGEIFTFKQRGICLYVNSFTLIILQDSTSDDNPFCRISHFCHILNVFIFE